MEDFFKSMTMEVSEQTVSAILPRIELIAKKAFFPHRIKGNEKAGDLIGVTADTMSKRVNNGYYAEGIHYQKKGDRIYLWDRDALLEAEANKRSNQWT